MGINWGQIVISDFHWQDSLDYDFTQSSPNCGGHDYQSKSSFKVQRKPLRIFFFLLSILVDKVHSKLITALERKRLNFLSEAFSLIYKQIWNEDRKHLLALSDVLVSKKKYQILIHHLLVQLITIEQVQYFCSCPMECFCRKPHHFFILYRKSCVIVVTSL